MSTLTKVVAVLLTVFSLFLCAMVITYVGTANNYKAMYDEQNSINKAIVAEEARLKKMVAATIAKAKIRQDELGESIQMLEENKNQLALELKKARTRSLDYESRVNSISGMLAGFEQTIANMEQTLKLTQDQLDTARIDRIRERKELNDITAELYSRITHMQALEADKRRLLEQKSTLEELLDPGQPVNVSDAVVTPLTGSARSVGISSPGATDLNGLLTEVGTSLVSISLGSADGVAKGMEFHVYRGESFICNIIITDVDINTSAGTLELVQVTPRVGDNVTTRL